MRHSVHRLLSRQSPFSTYCSPGSNRPCSFTPSIAFISTRSRPQYEHIDNVERIDNYRPGGYHPVEINNIFRDRYHIVHKLGYGSYSTIWLGWDMKKAHYVAMKIGTAENGCKDINILGRIHSSSLTVPVEAPRERQFAKRLIPIILDQIKICGPNGVHPCLITTPARCSLSDAGESAGYNTFQLPVARSVCAQLVMGVQFLHDRGYVHGDLHRGNILFQDQVVNNLSVKQLYDEFDPPDPEIVTRVDNMPLDSTSIPGHVYSPIWLGKPSNEFTLPEARILLSDFGTAFCPETESRLESYTPRPIRPPEVRFEPATPLSFSSDIWSLGCVIWEILGVRSLLSPWLIGPDDYTADQMDALGPLPQKWWLSWEKRMDKFDANGTAKEDRTVSSLVDRFEFTIQRPRRDRETGLVDDLERDAFIDMIKGMLAFSPGDRLTANQVLETRWMRDWAIPKAERSWADK